MTTDPQNVSARLPASTEMSPRHVVDRKDLLRTVPEGTQVYLTDLGNCAEDMIVRAARHLTDSGLIPVPHLAARRFASIEAFEQRIKRLVQEAGVKDVLTIAGETDTPGPLESSIALLETGYFDTLGVTGIAVAGHPEGARDIAPGILKHALLRKHQLASASDADFRIVTQFGFDPHKISTWLDDIRSWGNTFPVHIGVAGPAKMTTLLKYAAFAGVENSLSFLKKRSGAVVSMLSGYNPEGFVEPLENRVRNHPDTQLVQLHVYPFGGLTKTADWLHARGSWSFSSPSLIANESA